MIHKSHASSTGDVGQDKLNSKNSLRSHGHHFLGQIILLVSNSCKGRGAQCKCPSIDANGERGDEEKLVLLNRFKPSFINYGGLWSVTQGSVKRDDVLCFLRRTECNVSFTK